MFSSVEAAASASCAPASNPSQGSDLIQTEIPAQRLHRFDCFILLFAFLSFLFFFHALWSRTAADQNREEPFGPWRPNKKKIKSQCGFAQRFTSLTTREADKPHVAALVVAPLCKTEDERLVCVRSFRSRFFLLRPAVTPTGHPSPSASPPEHFNHHSHFSFFFLPGSCGILSRPPGVGFLSARWPPGVYRAVT